MLTTLKTKSLCRNLLLIFTLSLFFSCQKDLSLEDGGTVSAPPDLSTKINSSVSGFVTDENDAPVKGAAVQFGSINISTDKYGYFEAKNVQVVKEAAVVTVNKPGYFKGIKTYIAKEGKAAFFRIKLIPKTNVGNINAASGGTVTLANGLSIKLPAGGIVNAATNTAYTGTVNVAAFWINPTASDLNSIMPGDLRGINTAGSLKLLQTFGMAAVELTGAAGELLQIANGQKATLTLPIPSSLLASAPATIPLWYFDEAKGLWKEEGSAVKSGNSYVGDVSHFSFWNYDVPGNFVQFDCTLKDATGNPFSYIYARITVVGTTISRWGTADSSGYVNGLVPANAQLLLEIFPSPTCTTPMYTQTFATTSSSISFGNLTVINNGIAFITGNLTNCSNQAVTNGYVMMFFNNQYCRYNTNSSGIFNFSTVVCGTTSAVNFIGGDLTTSQEGSILNYNIVAGNNNIGNLVACGTSSQEFINYTFNGSPFSFVVPTDHVLQMQDSININSMIVYGYNVNNSSHSYFAINKQNISQGSIQGLSYFQTTQTGQTTIPNPISVHITEYGNINQFISGNFSGTVTGTAPPNNNYTITCNFRVRRTY